MHGHCMDVVTIDDVAFCQQSANRVGLQQIRRAGALQHCLAVHADGDRNLIDYGSPHGPATKARNAAALRCALISTPGFNPSSCALLRVTMAARRAGPSSPTRTSPPAGATAPTRIVKTLRGLA